MGTLLYGTPPSEIPMDDRLLSHLRIVITSKLRRSEPFLLSWDSDDATTRTSLWLHPAIPLQFSFGTVERPELNRAWLEEMSRASMSNEGLLLMPEPVASER